MITPQDIQDKVFDKAVRGYNADQVDIFLDELTKDLEALIAEKDGLAAHTQFQRLLNPDATRFASSFATFCKWVASKNTFSEVEIPERICERSSLIFRLVE